MALHRVILVSLAVLLGVSSTQATYFFPGIPFPATNEQKHSVLTPGSVVNTKLGQQVYQMSEEPGVQGSYHSILRSGQKLPGSDLAFGQLVSASGKPIYLIDSSTYVQKSDTDFEISPNMDRATFISTPAVGGRAAGPGAADLWAIVHFEAPNPAVVYSVKLTQDPVTGRLSATSYQPVDFSKWGGVWTPCAGSLTPWNSHMGSEEYEPNAKTFYAADSLAAFKATDARGATQMVNYMRYFDQYLTSAAEVDAFWAKAKEMYKPYRYGHVTEVKIENGEAVATKWYSLPRVASELGLVMPDQKTVYITDDGTNCGLFVFKADKAADLTTGSIYAAKFNQKGDATFDLEWILLAEGISHDATHKAVEAGLVFDDIFQVAAPKPEDSSCPEGFTFVNTQMGKECLKLKEGQEKLAAALETRRYAALLGATVELNKAEGLALDAESKTLYMAISGVTRGMLKEKATDRPNGDHMQMAENICGAIVEMALDDSFMAKDMKVTVAGKPDNVTSPGSTCSMDHISSPDNIALIPGQNILIIGEDTDYHVNNMQWAYDLKTGDLTRLMTAPYGAEVTGAELVCDAANVYCYYIANIQHPYSGEAARLAEAGATGAEGWFGYMGPFKWDDKAAIGHEHLPMPAANSKEGHYVRASYMYGKGVKSTFENGYVTLLLGNQTYGDLLYGQLTNKDGKPVRKYVDQATGNFELTDQFEVGHNTDYSPIVKGDDGKHYVISHFEFPNPAVVYYGEVDQDADKQLSVKAISLVDWSEYGGTYQNCAGSVSPWGSRMGSEEYEPNARPFEEAADIKDYMARDFDGSVSMITMARYFDLYMPFAMEQLRETVNPYMYGFSTEIKINQEGKAVATKHYTMGRVSIELPLVLPDEKTVYITDDGTNVGFFMFKADKKRDLSAGTLYAAKFTQLSAENGGSFDIEWIKLAHLTQEEMRPLAKTLKFSDIFETAKPVEAGKCPEGFSSINQAEAGHECLKLKEGQEKVSAAFETRRYAAMLGATTEFSKWEGITFDASRKKLYTAMSDIRYGMEDNMAKGKASTKYDVGGPNHLKIPYNKCGVVYQLDVNDDLVATHMKPLRVGKPDSSVPSNACDINDIASPDNIFYIAEEDQLMIAEDTSNHQNDALWIMDMKTNNLVRIMTSPYGAEITGSEIYDVNGSKYLFASIQHPYGESDIEKLNEPGSFGINSAVLYIGPIN